MIDLPPTEADDPDEKNALDVALPSAQVEWLEREARRRGSSVSGVVRALVASLMQKPGRNRRTRNDAEAGREGDADESNLVERLRSARERLDSLMETDSPGQETSEEGEFIERSGVLSSDTEDSDLRARAQRFAKMSQQDDEEEPRTIAMPASDRSMFEMVD